ncbi:MAG: carbamoyltransferase [Oligoflexales bacterium]
MYTLGINAVFHDSAACLVRDGVVVAAAEEERFTHIKHGKRPVPFSTWELPYHSIAFCLENEGIDLKDVDHVAYSFCPDTLSEIPTDDFIALPTQPSAHHREGEGSPWDPLFLAYVINAPRQLASGAPHQLKKRFLGVSNTGPWQWHFVPHHVAHSASAFYASPFFDAAVMTLDGRGEKASTTYGYGFGKSLKIFRAVEIPHSLGLLYERMTSHLGFLHSSDEYKVMALASFGKPTFLSELKQIVRIEDNGLYTIETFEIEEIFGPARERGGPYEQRHYDLAHSLQKVLEERVVELAQWLRERTKSESLCLAGGVALNCVMNSRLKRDSGFKNVWVQPAAGDAGTALGAALWVDAQNRPGQDRPYIMDHTYLGPSYTDPEIETVLNWAKLPYKKLRDVPGETADILAANKVVGWFQGRMEFGPRALGARSILASPIDARMQDKLNEIKDREDFRPVAPVVLEEEASRWFDCDTTSPFMLFVYDVKLDKADRIPAVRHTDGTARIQTVNRQQNALYYDVIKAFEKKTGVPVLVNTSFNSRGEPIVCSTKDAVECFYSTPLDALVIGSYMLVKE